MDKSKIRPSIVKATQLLAADCNQKIHDPENLIEAWHINLESITDEQIGFGLKKALGKKFHFMITSGEFKELILYDDADGTKKAQKLIEETKKYTR